MKNSIKAFIIIAAVTIKVTGLNAQSTAVEKGIYLTEHDYKTHHVSYNLGSQDKWTLNEFLNGKNVSLVYQGKEVKLAKSDIFGYRINGHNFRFYNNEAYAIMDTAGFLLYSKQTLTQQGKGYKPVEQFYFSVNAAQPVMELTVRNLWNSFPKQPDFRYSIQSNFNGDADLLSYDKALGEYKIKYLFFKERQAVSTQAKF
jgi:hypothetical protein